MSLISIMALLQTYLVVIEIKYEEKHFLFQKKVLIKLWLPDPNFCMWIYKTFEEYFISFLVTAFWTLFWTFASAYFISIDIALLKSME